MDDEPYSKMAISHHHWLEWHPAFQNSYSEHQIKEFRSKISSGHQQSIFRGTDIRPNALNHLPKKATIASRNWPNWDTFQDFRAIKLISCILTNVMIQKTHRTSNVSQLLEEIFLKKKKYSSSSHFLNRNTTSTSAQFKQIQSAPNSPKPPRIEHQTFYYQNRDQKPTIRAHKAGSIKQNSSASIFLGLWLAERNRNWNLLP